MDNVCISRVVYDKSRMCSILLEVDLNSQHTISTAFTAKGCG